MLLRTLGGLVLEGSALRRPKPLLLLAYLAVQGARDRKHLSELFWPEAARPMTSLRTALTQVRQVAPDVIRGEARLSAAVPCDARQLLEALEGGELERARTLYRGPFLEGFYLKELGAELEEWVFETREALAARLREEMLRSAERLTGGRAQEAAKLAEDACWLPGAPEADPEQLARAYRLLEAGGSARAREVRVAAEGFGLELNAVEMPQAGVPSPLPFHPGAFIGRSLELAELENLLAQEDCTLVTVVGAGGAGKTQLALKLAQDAAERGMYAGGVYFADLTALTDPAEVPTAVAAALGVSLPGVEPVGELALALAAKGAPLLVLDNFEHLLGAAGVVAEVVHRCPKVKLLVTSRERLKLAAEWVYRLGGFAVPTLDGAEESDAVRLFARRARRAQPGFHVAGHLPGILEVCRLVGGSPLGIELAAAWAGDLSPAETAGEIARSLDVLTDSSRDSGERHRSVRATFESSWALLSEAGQRALRRLAAFRGTFTVEAARAVTEVSPEALASLGDRGLVQRHPSGRLSRHPLVVAYSDEKAEEHPEEAAAMLARHGTFYLALVGRELGAARGPRVSAAMATEFDNLRDAWRWVAGQEDEALVVAAAELLERVWSSTGRYGEAEAAFAAAAAQREEASPLWAKLVALQGKYAPLVGQFKKGVALLQASLAVFRRHGRVPDAAFALRHLGFAMYHDGRYEEAEEMLREGLALAREVGEPVGVADCLTALGNVMELLENLDEAEALHREALAIFSEQQDFGGVATSLLALGDVEMARGRYGAARRLFERSARLRLDGGNTARAAGSLARLGDVALGLGDLEEAAHRYHEALSLALAALGLPWVMAALLGHASVFARRGEVARAAAIAASVRAEANTTRWYRERAEVLLQELTGSAEGEPWLPVVPVFALARKLLEESVPPA